MSTAVACDGPGGWLMMALFVSSRSPMDECSTATLPTLASYKEYKSFVIIGQMNSGMEMYRDK